MEFKNQDPGSTRYGNFINYYTFNSAEDRLSLLPTHIWTTTTSQSTDAENDYFLVLDLGCNSGNFTQLLHGFLSKYTQKHVVIIGIDIDSMLIQRAIEHNQYPNNIFYKCMNIMDKSHSNEEQQLQTFHDYFGQYNKTKFDAVFCLSLTMWIHLNNGDVGLQEFLRKISNIGKLLIVEPQPWKCYLTAVKRLRKGNEKFSEFKNIKWRQSIECNIEEYLSNDCEMTKIFETVPTKWKRKILFYVKTEKLVER